VDNFPFRGGCALTPISAVMPEEAGRSWKTMKEPRKKGFAGVNGQDEPASDKVAETAE